MVYFLVTFLAFCIRLLRGLWYLYHGPDIIDRAYSSAKGLPFRVPTPSNDHWFVTSNNHISELVNAPVDKLSLHAANEEVLQLEYTMSHFKWQGQRDAEGTGFVRVLRSRLTSHMPTLIPELKRVIEASIAKGLGRPDRNGIARCRLFTMIKPTVNKVNCFIFFGEDLARKAEFTAAALEFPQTVIVAGEILRITPRFLRRFVAGLVTQQHHAVRTLARYLVPVIEQRLAMRAKLSGAIRDNSPMDCLQWLIDTSPGNPPWPTTRVVNEILAVWIASVHQLAEYVLWLETSTSKMGRLMDAVTARRKALTPFIFSHGTRVETGNWVCVPQRAMMRDPTRYHNPRQFDGLRFARANKQFGVRDGAVEVPEPRPLRLTDVSVDWPIWGLGNTSCPGRFYAATVLKLILVYMLESWECQLADSKVQRWRTWRSSIVPREDTMVLFWRKPCRNSELIE
ncbi:cytochrome P450 [Aspergillus ellipticus CBS 707.79]|uniref:Cytochrome P450 n=1 Tax=Aspergillus ellipticus CBS 707.79 TaxID=1448320 RepID=A0A319DJQ8_9EURO|nr:cytochrome P450 [Aspergillus ellipticus CBS 707.79]